MERINVEFDITAKSDLREYVRNNDPITPGLPKYPTVFRIDGIKITYVEVKNLWNKTIHK